MEEILDARGLTEDQAIARYKSRNYPRPAMTADIVIFRRPSQVLLIRRGGHPFLGKWALPGGFANEKEPVEATALRELQEETGVSDLPLKLVDVFSKPGRDPRGWVVSVAYCAIAETLPQVHAGDDAKEARWFTLAPEGLFCEDFKISWQDLAFDHAEILRRAMKDFLSGQTVLY